MATVGSSFPLWKGAKFIMGASSASAERLDFIYTRQSVDRKDSISIESQIEYCQYETRGREFKVFRDKGFSGKNTTRPEFQEMLEEIRKGKCARVIVYKLDRISRSILDFTSMMEEFKEYGVEFVSCTEKFDTSSPMGRAMLNICIVFAQLERETIQMRVMDAYLSRSNHGFYMGGPVPYGFALEPYMLQGKKTSKYVPVPEEARVVRLAFEMYADPQTSFGDIVNAFFEQGIRNRKGNYWDRMRIADMIKNPVYLKADLDIYEFFKSQGTEIINAPEDFIGVNGCYLYSGQTATGNKRVRLKDQKLVIAPHEGLIPSDIWLAARKKCMNNKQVAKPSKAKNSWLSGKLKCGKCGYALVIKKANTKVGRYFICSHRMNRQFCEGVGGLDAGALEDFVLGAIKQRLLEFDVLTVATEKKANPKLNELRGRETQVSNEIDALMEKVAMATPTLMNYINSRIEELDSQRKEIQASIQELSAASSTVDIPKIKNYMDKWDSMTVADKQSVVDTLISVIRATEDSVEIVWKI